MAVEPLGQSLARYDAGIDGLGQYLGAGRGAAPPGVERLGRETALYRDGLDPRLRLERHAPTIGRPAGPFVSQPRWHKMLHLDLFSAALRWAMPIPLHRKTYQT
jgi:hypothetical protein